MVTYYINWIDPKTGFMKREEFKENRARDQRVRELRAAGVLELTTGHFSGS